MNHHIIVCATLTGYQGTHTLSYLAELSDASAKYSLAGGIGNDSTEGLDIIDLSFDDPSDNSGSVDSLKLSLDVTTSASNRTRGDNNGNYLISSNPGMDSGVTPVTAGVNYVTGTFRLDIGAVPSYSVRESLLGHKATTNGVTITLERLIVKPNQTRAYFYVTQANQNQQVLWEPSVMLEVGDWASMDSSKHIKDGSSESSSSDADNTMVYTFNSPLYGEQGNWILRVEGLQGTGTRGSTIGPITGPWNFQFTIQP